VIYSLGTNGDKETIIQAQKLFAQIVENNFKIDSDLRGIVYNLVAENGGEKEYLQFKKLYVETPFGEEKDRLIRALGAFKDKNLLIKTMDFAFSEDMRAQDLFKAIHFVWANPLGRDIAWDFVQKNWQEITRRFAGGHLYSRFIQPAVYFVDDKKALEIEEFFKKNPSVGLERTIAQVTEQIRANDLWLKRDKIKLSSFLQKAKWVGIY
jgi:puromycin-sensitive aminopeptidase